MTTLITDYVSLADFTQQVVRDGALTAGEQTLAAFCITSASRAVDQFTNRRFGLAPAPLARVFSSHGEDILKIDDTMTTTGLVVKTDPDNDGVYETTFVLGTDFDMYPANADQDGMPWTGIQLVKRSSAYWPSQRAGVQVTATWGWTAVPSSVEVATLIQAARFFVRRDSAYGVAGSPDLGNELRLQSALDPDVQVSLASVVRWWGAVAA